MRLPTRSLAMPVFVAIALIFAGCGDTGGGDSGGGDDLTGKVWLWSSANGTAPGSLKVVPTPEDYTIEFMTDGAFAAKVDCNQVAGAYTTDEGGAMTITPGPSTLAACPPGSLADLYLAGLSGTSAYVIENRQLILTTGDGTMTFGD